MDTLYHIRCSEGECKSIMLPDYKMDDRVLLFNKNHNPIIKTKYTPLHRKSYEYQNYENTYDNQFNYTFLDPIDNNFDVNEEFTDFNGYVKGNTVVYLIIYILVFTLLLAVFHHIKKRYF